jgi:oligoribonuclease
MTDMKSITPQKLLWLDLEMTGLDDANDRILEVAAIITDWDFREIASFETGVSQDQAAYNRLRANELAASRPVETEELITTAQSGMPETEAEEAVLRLIAEHAEAGETLLLAGNSIHSDRRFIRRYWPRLDAMLHYRMLDVSAWKVVMVSRYGVEFRKQEKHRALDDIRESIAELQSYLRYITIPPHDA